MKHSTRIMSPAWTVSSSLLVLVQGTWVSVAM